MNYNIVCKSFICVIMSMSFISRINCQNVEFEGELKIASLIEENSDSILVVKNNGNIGVMTKGEVLKNVPTPMLSSDAVNKEYVDRLYNIIFYLQNGLKDIDGNSYDVTLIGAQLWMAENLRVTRYNNGFEIPKVTEDLAWSQLSTPAYSWYLNDSIQYSNPYGALYNHYVVADTNSLNVCPLGWHVPTDQEFTDLTNTIGGEANAGNLLKEQGSMHWHPLNEGIDEYNFTAIPSSFRFPNGLFFSNITTVLMLWSSTEAIGGNSAWIRWMGYNQSYVDRNAYNQKGTGAGVRCILD